jgi:hypothetical protein
MIPHVLEQQRAENAAVAGGAAEEQDRPEGAADQEADKQGHDSGPPAVEKLGGENRHAERDDAKDEGTDRQLRDTADHVAAGTAAGEAGTEQQQGPRRRSRRRSAWPATGRTWLPTWRASSPCPPPAAASAAAPRTRRRRRPCRTPASSRNRNPSHPFRRTSPGRCFPRQTPARPGVRPRASVTTNCDDTPKRLHQGRGDDEQKPEGNPRGLPRDNEVLVHALPPTYRCVRGAGILAN